MQVLITRAAGTLGTALAPVRAIAYHEPVLFDIQRLNTAYRAVRGDVRTQADVHKATADVDLIVLTNAIHGIYHPIQDYFLMERTRARLGFIPRSNSGEWLDELRPDERAKKMPPWPW